MHALADSPANSCFADSTKVDAIAFSSTEHFPFAANSGWMKCHAGIEHVREPDSERMRQIMERGQSSGDPAGCVVCHGGDANEEVNATTAHGGATRTGFYPAAGSPWINEHTCGQRHPQHVSVQRSSLRMTEAGKIQGVCRAFGSITGDRRRWGNDAVQNPEDPSLRLGTDLYRVYIERLGKIEPDVFVDLHEPLPDALRVDELHRLNGDSTLAAFTHIRQERQRCHHAVKGRQRRGAPPTAEIPVDEFIEECDLRS